MAARFTPRLDILPPPQRRLWAELSQIPATFSLYGGTAIALYLGHRRSRDFDFFSLAKLNHDELVQEVRFLREAEVIQSGPDTLTIRVDRGGPVQVSFFGVPALPRLRQPQVATGSGVRVASLLDLAGTKAMVVQKRAEAKDYVDLDALISHGVTLATALAAGRALYGKSFNPQVTLKALSYFEDGDLPSLPGPLKRRLQDAVRQVDLRRLPAVTRTKRTKSRGRA